MFGEKVPAHHPAAISTAKFCIQEIEKSGGGEPGQRQGGWGQRPAWEDRAQCRGWARGSAPSCLPGSREATTVLHMLTLLKDLLPCFPESLVKSCSETLLRVMTLSHVVSSARKPEEHARVGGELQTSGPKCWCLGTCLGRPEQDLGSPHSSPTLAYHQGLQLSLVLDRPGCLQSPDPFGSWLQGSVLWSGEPWQGC